VVGLTSADDHVPVPQDTFRFRRRGAVIDVLDVRLDAIADACRAHGVARLDDVGSAARGGGNASVRDVDLLVEFVPMPATALAEASYGLRDDLRTIVAMPVDLVMHDGIRNEYIRTSIDRYRRVLHAA
jgi:uncharacterized protein